MIKAGKRGGVRKRDDSDRMLEFITPSSLQHLQDPYICRIFFLLKVLFGKCFKNKCKPSMLHSVVIFRNINLKLDKK